jgi:mono/diheme cytochrome c family protein
MNKLQTLVLMSIIAAISTAGIMACAGSTASETQMTPVERGRYMVTIGGCNDCHTAGYAQSERNVPEEQWLTGDSVGWRGPWGTTYPPNLRLYMQDLSEDQWVARVRELRARPPMPWFNLNRMTDEDLRAVYQFIRSLGPAGEPAPSYLPPDQEPPPPYFTQVQ